MFYPEELIEEIRQSNDIVDVISSYVKLAKRGSTYMGICPFHNEKSPSFAVSGLKQMYHCFGCGVGGNVITFIMEYENYSFVEAVKYLANRVGISLPDLEYNEEAKKQADLKGYLLNINREAGKYYYYQLKSERGKQAREYLKERMLSDQMIRKFGLGYSNKFSNDLYRYLKNIGYEDSLLKQSGLFTFEESKGVYDKFWNRVMFPIMDINNKIIGFGGRVMGGGSPKYLNSPETKLFDKSRNLYGLNLAKNSKEKSILLCEGYMDVIALHQAGFSNAVASLGTALTGLQANLLKRYVKEVRITYDSDEAGTKAALRAIPILKEAGLTVRVVNMAPYKDPDEFIKAKGAAAFHVRVEEATNSFLFEIQVLEREYDLNEPDQKTNFYNKIAKKLLGFSEELERNNYIEAVAKKYHINYENLKKLVNRLGIGYIPNVPSSIPQKKKKKFTAEDGKKQSQKLLLAWLMDEPYLFESLEGIIEPDDFTEEFCHRIAGMVYEQFKKEGKVTPAKIINHFESKEEQNEAASLFHTLLKETMSKEEKEKAINETVQKVKKQSLEAKAVKASEKEDINTFQQIIKEQAELQKLHISLKDG